jgi:hypothetical protein
LRNRNYLAILFQYQMAKAFSSSADFIVRPSLVNIGIIELIQYLTPGSFIQSIDVGSVTVI